MRVCSTSFTVKRPYWYSVETSGIASTQSASAAGRASMNASRSPQSSSDGIRRGSASAWDFASDGSSTVPSATPRSALGNSISRSAYVIHEMRPSPSAAASCVLMSAEICAADTPSTAGPIAASTRRTPSSRQSKRGATSIPIFASGRSCSDELRNAADEHAPRQRLDRRIDSRAPGTARRR